MMPHHRYSPRALGGLLGRCGMWHALCLAPSRRQGPTAGRGPAPPARPAGAWGDRGPGALVTAPCWHRPARSVMAHACRARCTAGGWR